MSDPRDPSVTVPPAADPDPGAADDTMPDDATLPDNVIDLFPEPLPYARDDSPAQIDLARAPTVPDGGPRPVPLTKPLALHEVDQHRHFACAHYDACLSVVVAARWPSFSCARCPLAGGWAAPLQSVPAPATLASGFEAGRGQQEGEDT